MKKETVTVKSTNKEKSRQRLLDAVGIILKTQGYSELRVNHIAAIAGLHKKLIYNYFGSKDNLVGEYIKSKDFWSNVKEDGVATDLSDGGKEFSIEMLLQQFDFLRDNVELQKVLLWRLSEEQPFLRQLTVDQENVGEQLFKAVTDPHFKDKADDYRAITALLVAGIYYLNLYSTVNGSIFCGLDLNSAYGKDKIRQALSLLISNTYDRLQPANL